MKKCKFNNIPLILLIFFSISLDGWGQDSFKDDLKLVLVEIQDKSKKQTNPHTSQSAPLIIAIGGCPGVGKSTISQLLKDELSTLGLTSVIISLDHYGLSQSERKQFTSELDPRRIQWNNLHKTLKSICKGANEVIKPTINQISKEMGQETLQLSNVDCILFEGCYTLCDFPPMNFLKYADLKIYLESSLENIYDWKWQRELKKISPRSPQSFFNHMAEIMKDFAFHVYPTRKNADYIVQIDFFHHYSVSHSKGIKSNPTLDFTSLRLEMLTY